MGSNRANSHGTRRTASIDHTKIGKRLNGGWILKVNPDFHPALDAINTDDVGDDDGSDVADGDDDEARKGKRITNPSFANNEDDGRDEDNEWRDEVDDKDGDDEDGDDDWRARRGQTRNTTTTEDACNAQEERMPPCRKNTMNEACDGQCKAKNDGYADR